MSVLFHTKTVWKGHLISNIFTAIEIRLKTLKNITTIEKGNKSQNKLLFWEKIAECPF
jgi:hypothetical protein